MNIEYYKKLEPFWGVWKIKKLLGEGSFGKVFEIEREDFGRTYKAALKVITIPQSESELKSVLADGLDAQSVTEYYRSFVMEVVEEFALMADFKGNSNIVSYEDHMVVEHQNGIGWDILIRMELLTPLLEYTSAEHPMGRNDVIKLGVDMCRALEYCRKQNVIHRDIKPENIFVSRGGDFKLGDFGIARTAEKTMSGLSRKGTFSYMAPEVYKGEEYGASVDIYSLGIVLYRLLNKNRTPFLPVYPKQITHSDRENAIAQRIAGQQMALPVDAQDRLGKIILKACAFRPQDRYTSPEQMRMELEFVDGEDTTVFTAESIEGEETQAIVSNLSEEKTMLLQAESSEEATMLLQPESQKKVSMQSVDILSQGASVTREKKQNPIKLLAAAAAIIALLGIAGIVVGNVGGKKEEMVSSDAVSNDEADISQEDVADDTADEDENTAEGLSDTESESDQEVFVDDTKNITDIAAIFGLDRDTVTDYGNALEPQRYLSYNSGCKDFYFSYPADLYCDVQVNRETNRTDYGENTETVRFMGTDGSELVFILSKRMDTNGMEDMTRYVYNVEHTRLYEATELINSVSEDHGKVILTGYTGPEKQIVMYDMTKIEEDYVMQMRVLYPEDPRIDNEKDKTEKWYVVECLYRLCGFSDTKYTPRTFDEYVESTKQ